MGRVLRPDGNRIRAYRLNKGWPREQLAQIAAVSPRAIRRIEDGNNASFETLRAIAAAFGLEVFELMKGSITSSGPKATLESRASGLLPTEILPALLTWCLPYAPAARGLMASFALVLLGASAISISPLLIEPDAQLEIADYSQSFTQSAPPAPPALRIQIAPMPPAAVRLPAPRTPRVTRLIEPVVQAPPVIPTPIAAQPPPQLIIAAGEHSIIPKASQPVQSASVVQTLVGVVHTHWLADLAQPARITTGHAAQFLPKNFAARPGRTAPAESANRGPSGGYSVLGRPFIRSGKSTASFFVKVGGSIKRVF